MRILIAGGFGFVGGRIAEYLANAGYQIILASRNHLSSPVWLPQAQVVKITWDDADQIERICNGIDLVIDAAGMNAQDCTTDPVAALSMNGLATARLVAAAIRAKVKKFIYISTAHVYANPLVGIITEEICPHNLHPYATSHLAGEYAVLGANQQGDIHGTVLRLSNAFGAPTCKEVNCWMLLVNDLCRQSVEKRKLTLNSSGKQYRNFIGLTDVCRIVTHFVGENMPVQSSIFNVGHGYSKTVLDMAKLIQLRCSEVLGFEPELSYAHDTTVGDCSPLIYSVDRLISHGVDIKNQDETDEIDRLLQFCQAAFNPGRT